VTSAKGSGAGPHEEGGGTGGSLVVVATPIGNLGDLSARAREVLGRADRICCEDTRRTRALLSAMAVPARGRLVSLHGHNERARIEGVLGWLGQGLEVALVTDAGTPAVSDPGGLLIRAAADAGIAVTAVPGPSAVLAALVVSGLAGDRFCMEGFLPRQGTARRRRIEDLASEPRTAVLLEAPGRVEGTLADLASCWPGRRVAVARELTKLHEEVWRGTLQDAAGEFAGRELRGEVVIVLEGVTAAPAPVDDETVAEALRDRLGNGEPPSRAAAGVAAELGLSRRDVYERALRLRAGSDGSEGPDEPDRR
jgi:16S rRNA (cytidine1402-2'-O)-methyltransferase